MADDITKPINERILLYTASQVKLLEQLERWWEKHQEVPIETRIITFFEFVRALKDSLR